MPRSLQQLPPGRESDNAMPAPLDLHAPLSVVLPLLAANLEKLARSIRPLTDLTVDLQIDADGSAVLRFRACR